MLVSETDLNQFFKFAATLAVQNLDESELGGNPDFPFTLAFHPHFVLHNAVGAVKKIVEKIVK